MRERSDLLRYGPARGTGQKNDRFWRRMLQKELIPAAFFHISHLVRLESPPPDRHLTSDIQIIDLIQHNVNQIFTILDIE